MPHELDALPVASIGVDGVQADYDHRFVEKPLKVRLEMSAIKRFECCSADMSST
jgi:hypothetical protein